MAKKKESGNNKPGATQGATKDIKKKAAQIKAEPKKKTTQKTTATKKTKTEKVVTVNKKLEKPAPINIVPKNGFLHVEPAEPTLRYSDEELSEFKELIEARILFERNELIRHKSVAEKSEGRASSLEESMLDISLSDKPASDPIKRSQELIGFLQKALIRIEQKTYGICRVTGELIPKARLRLVLHATTTVAGKERENQQRMPQRELAGQENR